MKKWYLYLVSLLCLLALLCGCLAVSVAEAPEGADLGALIFWIDGPDERMPMTISYSEFTGGQFELDDLAPGTYTVTELNADTLVEDYTLQTDSITSMTVVVEEDGTATASLFNHYAPSEEEEPEEEPEEEEETVDIPVTKIWEDNNNEDGNRPESISVTLYANGAAVDSATLSAGTGWAHTFEGLPKNDADGNEIAYSVNEAPVPMYTTSVSGTTITNTYQREVTSVSVQKIWDDDNNAAGKRPSSIAVTLSNGQIFILSEGNGWSATASDLPVVVNGQPVTYSWTEQSVIGYVQSGASANGGTTVFTNSLWQRPELADEVEKPKVPGDTYYVFEEYETPLGVEVMINHVGDCFD